MKKLFPLAVLLAAMATSFAGPYDTWAKYRVISINTTSAGANIDSAQVNFPLLVRLDSVSAATGANVLTGSLTAGGLDVRFTDSTGQVALSFERERWSSSGAEFWVKVPVVAPLAITKIRMYWGMAGQPNASAPTAVFDTASKFAGVWHMNGATDSTNELDATQNGLTAAQQARPASIPGAIGLARNLDTAGFGTGLSRITLSTATGLGITPNAISFPNTRTGYAVGAAGAIRKTVNGGAAWTTQTSGTSTRALRGVVFAGPNLGVIVGDSGTILRTTNGGATWTAGIKDIGTSANLNAVTYAGAVLSTLIAVGDSGVGYRSVDSGATWVRTASLGSTNNYLGIATEFSANSVIIAVGDSAGRGVIRRFTTPLVDGTTMTSPANTSPTLRAVTWAFSGSIYIAVGDSGIIRRSTSATAWTTVTNPGGTNTLRAVYGQAGIIYAVGDSGKILRSAQYTAPGSTFFNQTTGTAQNLTAVSAFYAAGAANTVVKLEDYKYFAVDGSSFHPATNWTLGGKYTVAHWVNPASLGQRMIVHKGEYQGGTAMNATGFVELVEFGNASPTGWQGGIATSGAGGVQVPGTWSHVTAARDSNATAVRLYVNGVLQGTTGSTSTNPREVHRDIFFGRGQDINNNARVWIGGLDEIQISTTNRSRGWAVLSYATQRPTGQTTVTMDTAITPTTAISVVFNPASFVDTVGRAATHTPATTGTITTCVATPALPAGLTVTNATCAISGTPTAVSAAQVYKIKATGTAGTDSMNVTLSVVIPRPTVVFNPSTVVDTLGRPATHTPVTTGTITSCTVVTPALPAGLSINNTTCVISGTPTGTVGTPAAAYRIKATNSTGSDSTNLTLSVINPTGIRPGAFVFRVSGEKPYGFVLPAAAVASTERIRLTIADAYGRTVWEKTVNPSRDGTREVSWNGRTTSGLKVSNGMYMVRLSILSHGVETELVDKTVKLAP
jgi:photosystem II stability/assembly factor-like uncharacterized protein